MRLGWGRKGDHLSLLKKLEVIFCFLTNRKCDFFKSINRWLKWSNLKCDLVVEKAMLQRVAYYFESFSASWPTQNSTCVRSKKWCFKGSHGTPNLFWTSGVAQNAIWMKSKKQWFKLSKSLWIHYLHLDQPKMWLFQINKALIQVFEWHLRVIFFLLKSPKFDFRTVEKAMFQVVTRPCELISFLLTNPKWDLGEIEKAMFQWVAWHF